MSTIKLIVPLTDLYVSKGKHPKIHGTIFFETKDFKFPDALWNDFVVVILGWWIQNLYEARRDEKLQIKFLFMDGPVEVRVKFVGDTCQMRFIRRWSDTSDIIGSAIVSYDELTSNLIDVAQDVIVKADQNKWKTRGLATLKQVVKLSQDGLQ